MPVYDMVRLSILILTLALSGANFAHPVHTEWHAHKIEKACFLAIRSGENFLDQERFDDSEDIEVNVSFSTPHPGVENIYAHLPGIEPDPILLIVQVLPSLIIQKNELTISDVKVESGDRIYPMVLDHKWADAQIPIYVLGGDAAKDIWTSTETGQDLRISLLLGGTEQLGIDIPRQNLGIARIENATCITEVAMRARD